jgi:hypothetical protein
MKVVGPFWPENAELDPTLATSISLMDTIGHPYSQDS